MNSNRLNNYLENEDKILSIFLTAGFPKIDSLVDTCVELENSGVKMIEIGFPFSDPIADGETIQKSSELAIKNGMNLEVLFEQLKDFRSKVNVPCLLMGYLNPVIQYGIDRFLDDAKSVGIDGIIIPDLPMYEYKNFFEEKISKRGLVNIFLITPQTSVFRIREIDNLSNSFIYAVSSQAVTGGNNQSKDNTKIEEYYKFLENLNLKNKIIVGFGISDKESFNLATKYFKGGIVGSAFLRSFGKGEKVSNFISSILK